MRIVKLLLCFAIVALLAAPATTLAAQRVVLAEFMTGTW